MTFSVESVICRLASSCMSGHLPSVLSHVSWKNDLLSKDPKLPTLKAQIQMLVTSLPRTVTAFEPGRSFFQLKSVSTAGKWSLMQEPANRHTTDSTKYVIQNNFDRFFRGFQRFLLEQLKTRLLARRRTRETMQKEIRIVRRSQVLLYLRRKNGKFQMSGLVGLGKSCTKGVRVV